MPPKRKVSATTVAAALQRFVAAHGNQPTIEELRAELGVGSTRTVLRYLKELEQTGIIERWSGARGIRFTQQPQNAGYSTNVPIIGEAPAGPLLLAEENFLGHVRITRERRPSGQLFLLRVRGDSMNRAMLQGRTIENGDLVLVRQSSVGRDDDIVVALIDGQATIKRLKFGPHYVVLKPESTNPDHSPFVIQGDLAIQGVVIDVLKGGETVIWDN